MYRSTSAKDRRSLAGLLKKRRRAGTSRQLEAEEHMLFVLVGFAGSVIATRSFLEWTGYPQIATGELHIAHVLWGGLFLFVAALLLLIWRGRTIFRLSGFLTGIGFGLFIDEVGKFITQSNDYFYPPAAPIIYAFFLLTVLVYLGVRRSGASDGRGELQRIVALLEAGIDAGTSREQYQAIRAELALAAQTAPGRAGRLAREASAFLDAEALEGSGGGRQASGYWTRAKATINRWLTPSRLRRGLTMGFALLALRGLVSGVAALLFTISIVNIEHWQQLGATATPLSAGGPFTTAHLIFVSATLTFEGILGGLFAGATGLVITGRTRRGLEFGYWGLLLSLTAVRFLVLYFNQFDAILTTVLQFGLMMGVLRYRSHYLIREDVPTPKDGAISLS